MWEGEKGVNSRGERKMNMSIHISLEQQQKQRKWHEKTQGKKSSSSALLLLLF